MPSTTYQGNEDADWSHDDGTGSGNWSNGLPSPTVDAVTDATPSSGSIVCKDLIAGTAAGLSTFGGAADVRGKFVGFNPIGRNLSTSSGWTLTSPPAFSGCAIDFAQGQAISTFSSCRITADMAATITDDGSGVFSADQTGAVIFGGKFTAANLSLSADIAFSAGLSPSGGFDLTGFGFLVKLGAGSVTPAYPANSDVRSGVGSGTCHVPSAANTLFGVAVDATDTGLAHVPDAADVRNGTAVNQTTGTAFIPAADDVRFNVDVDATVGNIVLPTVGQVEAGVTYDIGSVGTYSGGGGGTITEGDMIPIASADVTVGTGSTPVAIQDVSTTVSGQAFAVRMLCLDVASPVGTTVKLTAGYRIVASGRVLPLPPPDNYLHDGAYPIPPGTSASFFIPLPPAIDSVVVYATHNQAGDETVTSGGSLA